MKKLFCCLSIATLMLGANAQKYAQSGANVSQVASKSLDKKYPIFLNRCVLSTSSNNLNPSGSVTLSVDFAGYTAVVGTTKWYRDDVYLPTWKGRNIATSTPGVYKYSIDVTQGAKVKNIVSNAIKIELIPINTTPPPPPPPPTLSGTLITTVSTQSVAGMNYKLFAPPTSKWPAAKGILVIGSGNNESNPGVGAINGAAETNLAQMAADNGYAAAILGYEAGTPNPNNGTWDFWNNNAIKMGNNFDACISKIATDFNVAKSNAVVAGFSYTSFLLLSENSLNSKLSYCKGLIASCGGTGSWSAQNFKYPVYAITGLNNGDGEFSGLELFNQIPVGSGVKGQSGGLTDPACRSHCGADWTLVMFNRLKFWIP